MGYTFICERCGEGKNREPPFIGEFVDTFLKTSPSPLTQDYSAGQTVTICQDCMEEIIYG